MKKVMFGLAAAAAIAAFGIESANTVGYATFSLTGGKQDIVGTPFVSVGGSSFSIQDLTLSDPTDATDWIKVYNPLTGRYEKAIYFDEIYETLESEDPMGAGWGDDEGTAMTTTIDPGQGFWMYCGKNNTVTVPGEVLAASENTTSLTGGKQDIVAGIFPVATSIQSITLSAPTDATDWIKIYNPSTGKYEKSIYFDEIYETLESEDPMGSGWGDDEGTAKTITWSRVLDVHRQGYYRYLRTSFGELIFIQFPYMSCGIKQGNENEKVSCNVRSCLCCFALAGSFD